MEAAIVTGASRGCGLAIAKRLVGLKYVVYGLARDFGECTFSASTFHPVSCDLSKTGDLLSTVNEILEKEKELKIVVNNAGIGFFGPHETISPLDIEQMILTNLLAPILLTQTTLRALRKTSGYIINISSTAAMRPHRFGCAYAATKAGLAQFGRSLFQEVRKRGIKVVTVYPDFVQSSFHDNADFKPSSSPDSHLEPACVASAVEQILSQREGTLISEIVLEPQKFSIEKKIR